MINRPQAQKLPRGFTLIEIVLVMAIGGLILVIVFLALTGAQRARRDHQRKQDLAEMVADISEYQGQNRYHQPSTQAEFDDFLTNYYKIDRHLDPSTQAPYVVTWHDIGAPHGFQQPAAGHVVAAQAHICNRGPGGNYFDDPPNFNPLHPAFAAVMGLEQGWVCLDNGG
jgi:prepilin-type N-terminal cleavage/methylation domain-containing protein